MVITWRLNGNRLTKEFHMFFSKSSLASIGKRPAASGSCSMGSSLSCVGGENDVSFAITEKAFLKLCVDLVVLIMKFEKCPLLWGLKIYHLVLFNISFEPSAVKPNMSQILVKSVIVNIQYECTCTWGHSRPQWEWYGPLLIILNF